MKKIKALILAGGRGQRATQISANNNKCMALIHGHYIIDASLDHAAACTDEIIVVVGYYGDQIISHIGISWKGKPVIYVVQEQQKGLLDAMKCAQPQLAGSDFLLFLGDEILVRAKHNQMIDEFYKNKAFAVCGLVDEENKDKIKKTYCVHMVDGMINKLVEKPSRPDTSWMGTGNCIFSSRFFDFIHQLDTGSNLSFPDVLQLAIDAGEKVYGTILCDQYYNINTLEDFVECVEETL